MLNSRQFKKPTPKEFGFFVFKVQKVYPINTQSMIDQANSPKYHKAYDQPAVFRLTKSRTYQKGVADHKRDNMRYEIVQLPQE